jgi:hypothetical protein
MSEVKYRIHCDVELPVVMQSEMSYDRAFELVCIWNDRHAAEEMAWLERCDEACS